MQTSVSVIIFDSPEELLKLEEIKTDVENACSSLQVEQAILTLDKEGFNPFKLMGLPIDLGVDKVSQIIFKFQSKEDRDNVSQLLEAKYK